jgi:hypothetical protein
MIDLDRFRADERFHAWDAVPVQGPPAPAYVVGLDLGKMSDYTALSILERHQHDPNAGKALPPAANLPPARYEVRYLKRWPLRTSYVQIVEDVAAIVGRAPLGPKTDLVIDHGGVGVAVLDMFRRARLPCIIVPVTIHGGDAVTDQGGGAFGTPKRELVGTITVLLQTGRLKISPGLAEARTLTGELQSFEVRISQSGHDSYDARSGAHDDLVLSVALAAWWGERPVRKAWFF